MLRRDRETKDMTLLQLYRTGAPEGNKLRLSSDKLVSALSFDKLYESLLLPEDIASAEEAVWAKLGSATSFIADLGLGGSAASTGEASRSDHALRISFTQPPVHTGRYPTTGRRPRSLHRGIGNRDHNRPRTGHCLAMASPEGTPLSPC